MKNNRNSQSRFNDTVKNIFNIFKKILSKIKLIINLLLNKSFQLNKICIVQENNKLIYSLRESSLYIDEENSNNIRNCILSDSLVELKIVKIPVVEKSILKMQIYLYSN